MMPTHTLAMDLGAPLTPAPNPLARKIDLAHALGVNKSTITKAAQAGRLVPAADPTLAAQGWYDRAASLARFRATRGDRLDLVELHAAKRRAAAAAPAGDHPFGESITRGPDPQDPATAHATGPDPQATRDHRPPGTPDPASAPQDRATPVAGPQGQASLPPHAAGAATARPRAPRAGPNPAPSSAGHQAPAADPVSGQDRAQVKGQILATENAITKLEIALARGHRLQLADVGRESHAWGQRLADHLLRVIDQIAARLAAVPDPAERQRLLRPELRRVRRAFDQAGIASLRALKAAGRRRESRP